MDYTEIAPGIRLYPRAIADPQRIKDEALADKGGWVDSQVGKTGEGMTARHVRNSRSYHLVASNPQWAETRDAVQRLADHYQESFRTPWNGVVGAIAMLHYPAADGFYVPHVDDSPQNPRAFSLVVYLNDVKEGGETLFTRFGVSTSPKAGDAVLFPASRPYQHEARTPVHDDKFVLVTFMQRVNHVPQRT